MVHGYDDKGPRQDEVEATVRKQNKYDGDRATRWSEPPARKTAENDPYSYTGVATDAARLTGSMANGVYPGDPNNVKISGYADVSDGSKNPAYGAQSEQSEAAAYAAFNKGPLKGQSGV